MEAEGISVEGLACERGGRVVVSDVSFSLKRGEALILRGPNGSGKTTLLRTFAGYLTPAAGRIVISGGDDGDEDRATHLHFIGHANGVKARLTVLENILFWQRYYSGADGIEIAENALDAFDLLHLADFRAAHLSQGQARRLGLARLLSAKRAIWLLDEPTVSLDAASVKRTEKAILAHLESGGMAIASTHGDIDLPAPRILELGSRRGSPT